MSIPASVLHGTDRISAGFVTFDDFFRIMKKKSDNPLDDLSDDDY
jgi:hypothetical protein